MEILKSFVGTSEPGMLCRSMTMCTRISSDDARAASQRAHLARDLHARVLHLEREPPVLDGEEDRPEAGFVQRLGHRVLGCEGERLRSTAAVDALRQRITW